ncbi:MAG: PRC-barrel domain-containing protein, partial [archaeon]
MPRISDIYGRRIYNEGSGFIGVAKDVLIDPAEGKVKFLLKEEASSILGRDTAEAKKFIRQNF